MQAIIGGGIERRCRIVKKSKPSQNRVRRQGSLRGCPPLPSTRRLGEAWWRRGGIYGLDAYPGIHHRERGSGVASTQRRSRLSPRPIPNSEIADLTLDA